ncbi:MAG: hypothetical protein H7Z10_08420 [Gemmatimonadaceae bacterium]|nr:hypothetical protein [Acetobacteraceae bacterium]
MTEMPKALMGGHQTFEASPAADVGVGRPPGQHEFENAEKVLRNLEVRGIASVVKGD